MRHDDVSPERKKSCHEFLKKLREEFHIKREDYKPREIHSANLPVIDLSPSKKEKKKTAKKVKKERYRLTAWYLFDYLKPEYAERAIMLADGDIDALVDWAMDRVEEYMTFLSFDPKEKREMSVEEWGELHAAEKEFKEEQRKNLTAGVDIENAPGMPILYIDPEGDIPGIYWEAYEIYCDDHPIKTKKQANKRKRNFIKMINKQYKKTYGGMATGKKGKHGEGEWNTINYMSLCIDKDRMLDNLKRLTKENVLRSSKYQKEMKEFFARTGVDESVQQRMMSRSKKINKSLRDNIDRLVIDIESNPESIEMLKRIPGMHTG